MYDISLTRAIENRQRDGERERKRIQTFSRYDPVYCYGVRENFDASNARTTFNKFVYATTI